MENRIMNRKPVTYVFLTVVLSALFLAGCGSTKEPVTVTLTTPEPSETVAPAAETEEPDSQSEESLRSVAEQFIDREASELIAAIGEPKATDYASSCLGPGQDGELDYDGFTVYTYKEGDSEVVKEVV